MVLTKIQLTQLGIHKLFLRDFENDHSSVPTRPVPGFLLWEIFVLSVLLKFGPHFRTKNELALLPWEASKLPHGHTQ